MLDEAGEYLESLWKQVDAIDGIVAWLREVNPDADLQPLLDQKQDALKEIDKLRERFSDL